MLPFIRRHLDPADRLGEVLFGLIMALVFTGAVHLGREEANNRTLFIGILGCNLAWAIVDGVMHALTAFFERGRFARLVRDVQAASTDADARRYVSVAIEDKLAGLTTDEQREHVLQWALQNLRSRKYEPARVRRKDVLGGVAIAASIVIATLPIVFPFLLLSNPTHAVRTANFIAIAELFLLGIWWGRLVGERPLRIALGLTLVGVVLVLIAIVLGG